jgi:hypothetical protein
MGMHHHWHRMGDDEDYERTIPDRVLFARMVRYISRQRQKSMMLVLAILASTLINLLPPYMFSLAIDRYIGELSSSSPSTATGTSSTGWGASWSST